MTRVLLLLSFCVALLASSPGVAFASTPPRWSEPVQLGSDLPSSWFPDLQADATGAFRVVWSASLTTEDANATHVLNGAVVISELGPEGWSAPGDIAVMDGGIASRPMIASDGQFAHLIYRTGDAGAPVRFVYSRAPLTTDLNDARSWSKPFVLSTGEAYWAQIATLPDGQLLVVYNLVARTDVNGSLEERTGIFARRSLDQGETWGPEVRLAETTERVARTSISVSPDGTDIVVAWDEGYDNLTGQGTPSAVSTVVSSDFGANWTNHQRFAEPVEQSVVSTDGLTTVLIYRSTMDDRILYRTSDDGGRTWSLEQPIPDVVARPYSDPHNFDKLSAAFDGDGRLLLTWVGADDEAPHGLSVMLATYSDGVWTAPQVVASPDGFPEYPRIAVALGNTVQLVYFVRDNEFAIGAYTLWAVSGESDASAVAPAAFASVYPTVVAQSTAAAITIDAQPAVPGAAEPVGPIALPDTSPQHTLTSPIGPVLGATLAGLLLVVVLRWIVRAGRDARI